jgi:hypothetical protein
MSSRRGGNEPASGLGDQFERDVEDLHQTVRAMGDISNAIHDELESHNRFLEGMTDRYHQGVGAVSKLVEDMKALWASTGLSPMTMTMLFCGGVVLLLWLYWKVRA